jgi:signal transduction histidine kinase
VEDIYQKNSELEYLNQEYEHVIYTLSHDLRSPLISIDGFIKKLIKVGQVDLQNATVLHCLDRIQANITMMDNLIKVLLDTSRITTGELHIQQLDMNELVDAVVSNFYIMAEKSGVSIKVKKDLGKMYGDPVRIGQVFNNLIANVFQHCSGTENLTIEIGHEKGIYWVKDNGPGIPEHFLGKMFESAARSENYSKNSFGMGMNIVYKIIQKHNGRVWLDSTPNMGTTVYFTVNTGFLT